jgi:hypothetical protein
MGKFVYLGQIFIASPGDCDQERECLARVIRNWNAAAGHISKTHLEAVRWETHCHPEAAGDAQQSINQQIVDHCDVAVAIFRSRIGTPTLRSISGTVEEIDRFKAQKKRVMLYFLEPRHRRGDTEQIKLLKSYHESTAGLDLTWNFDNTRDLEASFTRHLQTVINQRWIVAPAPGHEATSPIASSVGPTLGMIHSPTAALKLIRAGTSYLWPKLVRQRQGARRLTCEIKASSFDYIRSPLLYLQRENLMMFETFHAYTIPEDASRILKIEITNIKDSLSKLVQAVDQETTNYWMNSII